MFVLPFVPFSHLLGQALQCPLQSASVKLQRCGQQLLRKPKY